MSEKSTGKPTDIGLHRGVVAHGLLEAATWLAVISAALLTFALAGVVGFGRAGSTAELRSVLTHQVAADFDRSLANPAYLAVIVVLGVGSFLPLRRLRAMLPADRTRVLTGLAVLTGIVLIVFGLYPAAWMGAVSALFLGALTSLQIMHTPELHTKPWRTGTVAAAVFCFVAVITQVQGGPGAGMTAVPWVVFASGIVLAAAGVLILVSPLNSVQLPRTGAFPVTRALRRARDHAEVGLPWPVYALYAVLGAVLTSVIPVSSDASFTPAGASLLVAALLVGWAAGYEAGPTFAPGMTRPRLTAFSLIAAGVLALAGGVVPEVSGTALLFGATAFFVGVGARAQDYTVSRRIGIGAGSLMALLFVCLDARFIVVFSHVSEWLVTGSAVTLTSIGLIAAIAGVVALFTFSPTGIQGIGVDIVHAFRNPNSAEHPRSTGEVAVGAAVPAGVEGMAGPSLRAPVKRTAERGLFIAVEGLDGSGKSTQMDFIGRHLAARGLEHVTLTREPGGTPEGVQIRRAILDGQGVTPKAEALLYAADRSHHVCALIEPALRAGGIVVTDRYLDSSVAYQAAGRELTEHDVSALSAWATDGLTPNLTLLLDISPEASARRTAARGAENHLDRQSQEFRQRVCERFRALAEENPHRYAVIDADQPADAVSAQIARALDAALAHAGLAPAPGAAPAQPGGLGGTAVDPAYLAAAPGDEAVTRVMSRTTPPVPPADAASPVDAAASGDAIPPAAAPSVPPAPPADAQADVPPAPAEPHAQPPAAAEAAEPAAPPVPTAQAESAALASASTPAAPAHIPAGPAHTPAADAVPEVDEVLPSTEIPTDIHPAVGAAPDDDATRVLPQTQSRQSAERLRQQADIERRARQRLREARNRGHR